MTTARIGITGATGYIGTVLVARALRHGHEVVALGRRGIEGLEHRHADLCEDPAPNLLDALDAAIHLAADTGGAGGLGAEEIRFAEALAAASQRAGVPLLVVSSQAASPAAPSAYGRTKAAIEERVLARGASVLRPGLVYGGLAQGLFGKLIGLVRRLPVLPDLRPRPSVQPIHVEDLADALLAAALRNPMPGAVLCVAGPPIAFVDFLRAIARHRLRRRRASVPVPLSVLRAALSALSRVLGAAFSPERLDSLVRLRPMACDDDMSALAIQTRPLADGLSGSGRATRRLLREGQALMHGFLANAPSCWLARRYVLALRRHGQHRALELPGRMLDRPSLIAALDTPAFRRSVVIGDLAWRYGVAIRIVEASTAHAASFIGSTTRRQRLRALVDLCAGAAFEIQARLLRPFALRALRKQA